jgi:uncharacterized membrane protein
MAESQDFGRELAELRQLLAELTGRVYRLERAMQTSSLPAAENGSTIPLEIPAPSLSHEPPAPSSSIESTPTIAPAHLATAKAETNLDLEARIGSHWLNRIGIAAVLIGVSYFLKYAFDNNWIGPAGRITIGLLAGIAVVIWSERFRTRGYRIFSFSLKAVGIGVLYLSLWAAFQVYNLIPSGVAFVAMLLVTASTAALAIAQDAEILAAFALAGGFMTPVLLSTGQNREVELFSYLAILNGATLVLVVFKPWRRLLVLSFVGTLLMYVGWHVTYYTREQLRVTLGFATLFFAIFAVAPLIGKGKEREANVSATVPYLIAFLNAAVYFLQVYTMLQDVDKAAIAWFALALAGVYIFLSRQMRVRESNASAAATLHFLHLALAIGFITIAIPIRLNAHWITIGWFVEAAVLLWVAEWVKSDFLNVFAIAALALGVARLLFIDNFYSERVLLNARMAVHVVALGVLALVAWYGAHRNDDSGRRAAASAIIALNLLALVALSREVADYYSRALLAASRQPGVWIGGEWSSTRNIAIARDFTFSALWMGYGAVLMIVGFWRRSAFIRWQALVLIAATTIKVFVYDVSQLDRGYRILSFIVLGVLLLAISFGYQRDWLKLTLNSREIKDRA